MRCHFLNLTNNELLSCLSKARLQKRRVDRGQLGRRAGKVGVLELGMEVAFGVRDGLVGGDELGLGTKRVGHILDIFNFLIKKELTAVK